MQCVETGENKQPAAEGAVDGSSCCSGVSPRPSRRALHRHAVKKFNERRKNEERKRTAEERDEKLLRLDKDGEHGSNNSNNSNNNNSNNNGSSSSSSSSNEASHAPEATARKDPLAKPVLVSKWDFDFLFRIVPSELLPTSGGAAEEMLEAADADTNEATNVDNALIVPPSPAINNTTTTTTTSNDNNNNNNSPYGEARRPIVLLDDGHPRPPKGSIPIKAMMQSSSAKSIYVRRLEGVPPLPMTMPLSSGTDLDMPTWNYLLPDTMYNVHQHAPGFERDENAAKRSMLSCALQEWRNGDDNVLVLSTGETLRSVFEATYTDEKPLTLEVRRIGPILLVDSLSDRGFRARVRDMRARALLGKALYRIHHESTEPQGTEDMSTIATGGGVGANTGEKGVVTFPIHRVGSAALSREVHTLSRYSHIFRWEIDAVNLLVGIDTPIVLDRRDNIEYVLELRDASVKKTPQEVQREILRCWFDATLANVPQVGIYVHNDGIIQRYEVKKAQEMLGLVEGRMATVAMNFTTNVLQGLVSQCRKDGSTYAVIRNYESGALEIYECSNDEHLEKFLPEDGVVVHDGKGEGDLEKQSVKEEDEQQQRRAEESERLNWGLATMCYRMGMRLKDSEEKAPDSLSLLLRSFAVYFRQRSRIEEACHHVCDISKSLPGLVGRLINNRKAALEDQGGIVQLPEVYREAFQTCGRFEVRLQEAACDEDLRIPTRRAFLQCLLPCSAALCVCIARSMEQFCLVRSTYMRLRGEGGSSSSSSNTHIHKLVAKNLLQVVIEGLLRLEQMYHMLKSDTTLTQCLQVSPVGEEKALIDAKTEILDIAPLEATLWELYADVVLLVMGDRTPFTADALVELSRVIKSREEQHHHAAATLGDTTLTWMSAITHDMVSLSFTALRFITRVGMQSRRLMSKTAQVYYHVGHNYLVTHRYTKALDSLHRAESLFKAMQQGPPDVVFGESCTASATVTMRNVSLSLGDVFMRIARLKSCTAPVELRPGAHQPLAMGEIQRLSPEEESFYRQAVDHFTQCEANDRLAAALRTYASRQIGCIACGEQQADAAKGRHIHSMLRKVGELTKCDAALEWEVLRLFTCAPQHTPLQRRAEEIMSRWTGTTLLKVINVPPELVTSVHPLECTLQMALVSVVLLEAKKNLKMHQALSLARESVAYVIVALGELSAACSSSGAPETLLARAMAYWKSRCTHEWVYHIARIICSRVTHVILRHLPSDKASGARLLLQRLVSMGDDKNDQDEKKGKSDSVCKGFGAMDEACGAECHFAQCAKSLIEILEDVSKW